MIWNYLPNEKLKQLGKDKSYLTVRESHLFQNA